MKNKKTLVIIGHPDLEDSQSHQFLMQSGEALSEIDYLDLNSVVDSNGNFDAFVEIKKLLAYDRIILQFQLYWYQAPMIFKQWFDQVFEYEMFHSELKRQFYQKELGIVVIAGAKESHYHRDGLYGVTMDDLLSPYIAFAKYMGMKQLPHFPVYQFQFYTEAQKFECILKYICYLETGTVGSFGALQKVLLDKLDALTQQDLNFEETDWIVYENILTTFRQQAEEITELYKLNQGDFYNE